MKTQGISNASKHVIIIGGSPQKKRAQVRSLATLMVSPQPFSDQDLHTIKAITANLNFSVIVSPEISADRNLARFLRGEPARGLSEFDIAPATDDRPFFFNTFPPSAFWQLWTRNPLNWGTTPVSVLGSLLLLVTLLTLLCIVGPLLITLKRESVRGSFPYVLFFASIGFGFMIVEIAQVQRLAIFLGHPMYSLSVVLFTLLLSTGAGSYFTNRVPLKRIRSTGILYLAILVFVILVFGLTTPYLIRSFESATMSARILLSIVILAPAGFWMGTAFPLGMKAGSVKHQEAAAWFWGINGAASVCASVLAVTIALVWGISAAFWLGFACYAAALFSFVVIRRSDFSGAQS